MEDESMQILTDAAQLPDMLARRRNPGARTLGKLYAYASTTCFIFDTP
jgi:hypothetical protein